MAYFQDITGKRYGKLTALYPTEKRQGTNIVWCFRCDCGNLVERTTCHMPEDAACHKCKPRGVSSRKDYSGMVFGRLTALECTGKYKGKELIWRLQCECGNIVELPVGKFISGNTKSCGCLRRDASTHKAKSFLGPNPNFKDLTGLKFGMLTVIKKADKSSSRGRVQWLCQCECGKEVLISTSDLTDGKKRSCGCKDASLFCVFKHEFPDSRLYFGITAQKPWRAWFSGSKYINQTTMQQAVDSIGGYEAFKYNANHYYYTPYGQWLEITGPMPFEETNLFSAEEAERHKRRFIQEYRTTEPDFGLNAASGGRSEFSYSNEAKQRQSRTRSGEDGRKDWCTYIHTNMINGKKYVGVTCRDPKTRWSGGNGYRRPAKQGVATSHFFNAIQKYGWDNFSHEIVQEGMTKSEAAKLEKELIAQYDTRNPEKGYNVTAGGDGSKGAKHSIETREALSKLAKERAANGIVNFKGSHHSEETKAILREKAKQRAKEQNNPFEGKHHTAETKEKLSMVARKPVYQYDLDDTYINQYSSVQEAAIAVGASSSAISSAATGKTKTCKGYIWRFSISEGNKKS